MVRKKLTGRVSKKKSASSKRPCDSSNEGSYGLYITAIVAIVAIVFLVNSFSHAPKDYDAKGHYVTDQMPMEQDNGDVVGNAFKSVSKKPFYRTKPVYRYIGSPYPLSGVNSSNMTNVTDCYDSDGKNPMVAGYVHYFESYFNNTNISINYIDSKKFGYTNRIIEKLCYYGRPYAHEVECYNGVLSKKIFLGTGDYFYAYYCSAIPMQN